MSFDHLDAQRESMAIPYIAANLEINLQIILTLLLDDPEVTANIYCKSRNLPNTDTQNYSTDLQ